MEIYPEQNLSLFVLESRIIDELRAKPDSITKNELYISIHETSAPLYINCQNLPHWPKSISVTGMVVAHLC